MSKLITTVGMSGSGKSHLREKLLKQYGENDLEVISPDDIRKQITGSISDQSQNDRVFKVVKHAIKGALLCAQPLVYFDATNLTYSNLKKSMAEYTEDTNSEILIVFMIDSENYDLCLKRVQNDIEEKRDRSKVTADIMKKQHIRFKQCLENCTKDGSFEIFLYKGDSDFDNLCKEIDKWDED